MSADNVIYVKESGGKFYVWMTFMSDPRGPHMGDVTPATTLEEAMGIAERMAGELMVVEYGIQVIN